MQFTFDRKLLAAAGLALLLVTAGCAGLGSATPNPTATDGTFAQTTTGGADAADRSISVGASGQATAAPDRAVVRVAVEATGPDAATARDRLAANVSSVRDALRNAGIEDDQVRTAYYDLRAERDHLRKPTTEPADAPTTYRAIHAFEITLSEIDRAGEIVDVAVAGGATRVDGIRFTLSDEARRSLHEEALVDAMANARSQADVLASSADLAVTGVHTVQASNGYYGPRVAYASESGGVTSIESGTLTVTAHVQVTYDVTDA